MKRSNELDDSSPKKMRLDTNASSSSGFVLPQKRQITSPLTSSTQGTQKTLEKLMNRENKKEAMETIVLSSDEEEETVRKKPTINKLPTNIAPTNTKTALKTSMNDSTLDSSMEPTEENISENNTPATAAKVEKIVSPKFSSDENKDKGLNNGLKDTMVESTKANNSITATETETGKNIKGFHDDVKEQLVAVSRNTFTTKKESAAIIAEKDSSNKKDSLLFSIKKQKNKNDSEEDELHEVQVVTGVQINGSRKSNVKFDTAMDADNSSASGSPISVELDINDSNDFKDKIVKDFETHSSDELDTVEEQGQQQLTKTHQTNGNNKDIDFNKNESSDEEASPSTAIVAVKKPTLLIQPLSQTYAVETAVIPKKPIPFLTRTAATTTITKRLPVRQSRSKIATYNDVANSMSLDDLEKKGSRYTISYDMTKHAKIPSVVGTAATSNKTTKFILPPVKLSKRRLLKTGFVYDTAMSYHATPDPMEIHPEDPRRIFKIFNIMERNGLLSECKRIKSRRATKEEILLVHNILHYRAMRDTSELKTRAEYMAMENDFDSIYLNSNSFESGLYAVGSLIDLLEAVIQDQVKNAFAIIRPPGHHAEADFPMGFCLFNNVAIATRHCMKKLDVKKTLIVDWDIHFGNGTQDIFSEDPDVLYISLHRFEDGSFYPSDRKGSASYVGHGAGRGKTVNIPWPCAGMTDADYIYAFRHIVIPIAMEFEPDVVIVSAGFDAALNDPIGLCNVSPAGYGQMTHMLKSIANGKLVIALEGGYDLNSIAVSALACMNVLLGDAPEPLEPALLPKQECIDITREVIEVQKNYWRCMT